MTVDPLAEVVTLLQPAARGSKQVECAGTWRVHREGTGEPFYCAILAGGCRIAVDKQPPVAMQAGDFILIPALRDLMLESEEPPPLGVSVWPVEVSAGCYRIGSENQPANLRMHLGHCSFGSPDAELLVPLLPQRVVVRAQLRLATLMKLVDEETRARRAARELVLERLLEVLLIEALRCGNETEPSPGLARGLADDRVAVALCALHAHP